MFQNFLLVEYTYTMYFLVVRLLSLSINILTIIHVVDSFHLLYSCIAFHYRDMLEFIYPFT